MGRLPLLLLFAVLVLAGCQGASDRVSVIVQFEAAATPGGLPVERGARRQALVRGLRSRTAEEHRRIREFLDRVGASQVRELWAINGLALSLPADAMAELSALPGVVRVYPDQQFHAPPGPVIGGPAERAGSAPAGWNLDAVGAPTLWAAGHRGAGRVLAVIDTGVDARHAALAAGYRGQPTDWFDPHGEHGEPYDASGHGTQVLGLAVGAALGGQPIGVAPEARWIAAKVFDDAGNSSLSDVHLALQWALDPDGDPAVDDAPDVVLAAWGLGGTQGACGQEFERDLRALKAAGIALVFAAGNDGPAAGSGLSPATDPQVLSTGAVDPVLAVPDFSARGPASCDGAVFPKLAGPGVDVRTADLTLGGLFPEAETRVSGTSYAAAHTAGALLLLRELEPAASIVQLESALMSAADPLGAGAGHGLIDLAAAADALGTLRGLPADALGLATIDSEWRRQALAGSGQVPVVLTGPPSGTGPQPGVVRMRELAPDGFRLRFAEWLYLDGWHLPEQVPWLALQPGRWHLADGSVWEVGRFELSGINGEFTAARFRSGFGNIPALFLFPQTANGGQPVSVRARAVSSSGFEAGLFEEEAIADGHIPETIGYLAVHQPEGAGQLTVGGVAHPYRIGSQVVDHRPMPVTGGALLSAQEEQSADAETWHLGEQVDTLLVGDLLFAQDVSAVGGDAMALRLD